jgi:hypothetical protein
VHQSQRYALCHIGFSFRLFSVFESVDVLLDNCLDDLWSWFPVTFFLVITIRLLFFSCIIFLSRIFHWHQVVKFLRTLTSRNPKESLVARCIPSLKRGLELAGYGHGLLKHGISRLVVAGAFHCGCQCPLFGVVTELCC